MKALVTGGRGFVGAHLVDYLRASGDEVLFSDADITDGPAIREEILANQADALYHLAGLAHVGESWDQPAETFRVNALGTVEVLAAASACSRPPRVLVVSSAEVYGTVTPDEVPLNEDAPLRPVSPYAASKVAAEYAALQAHLGPKLEVMRARAFNHAGPGQAPTFLIPALARRIATAEVDGSDALAVGNLSPRRDFTDVRDVVRAYRLIIERGEPGQVYNVCTGVDVAVEEIADAMLAMSTARARFEVDPALMRPVDVPVLRGDNRRLVTATGWEPTLTLEQTLADVLAEARAAVETKA
ncbi:MAG: GDP-mannose 4,6-dehydratase [Acidimicrobiales bacterium]